MNFFQSAFVLSMGSFFSKILGALYRFPLLRLIGVEELARYQMVYPVYALLLTFSSVGLPSAISYLVASGKRCISVARKTFLPIGILSSALLCIFAYPLSLLQGRKELVWGYFAIAPSIILVTEISILRGEFQGQGKMLPTSLSQVIEQAVKIGLGLFFAYRMEHPFPFLLLAVTIGELFALLYLHAVRLGQIEGEEVDRSFLLKRTVPVTLSACILPFSSFLDSILLVHLAGETSYGLFSGCINPLVSLSSSLSVGCSGAIVYHLADGKLEKIKEAISLTLVCALPVVLFLAIGAKFLSVLFGLEGENVSIFMGLLYLSLPACFLLPLVQTMAGCLTGLGRAKYSAYALSFGAVVKVLAELLLTPRFGIYGGAISADLCFLVAFFLELMYSYNLKGTVQKRILRSSS